MRIIRNKVVKIIAKLKTKRKEKKRNEMIDHIAKKIVKNSINQGIYLALYGRFDLNGDYLDSDSNSECSSSQRMIPEYHYDM
jgi:hypothetical protein